MTQTTLGGVDGDLSAVIYGAVIGVDPGTGSGTIVNNQFGVTYNNTRGGPTEQVNNPLPIHLDGKNRVYGIGLNTYDTTCQCTEYWSNIYMVTP